MPRMILSGSATAPVRPLTRLFGVAGAVWGVLGVSALLGSAVARLWPLAVEALEGPLGPVHWAALAANLVFMGYAEGYRAFQRAFSPRVVARALHLQRNPRPLHVLLAPLYCMGLIHATRKRLVASWIVSSGVVVLVISVRMLPQPWRGIVDAGVVLGLTWGLVAIGHAAVSALAGRPPRVSPEVPLSR